MPWLTLGNVVVRVKAEQAGHGGLCIGARTAEVQLPSTTHPHRAETKAEKSGTDLNKSSHTGAFNHPSSVPVETSGVCAPFLEGRGRTGRE